MRALPAAASWRCLAAVWIVAACGDRPQTGAYAVRDTVALGADTIAPGAEMGAGAEADTARDPSGVTGATAVWTAGIVEIPSDDGISTLVSVRTARHEGFDRVAWELAGAVPGVRVEYVDRPVRACGSGEPVPLPGDAWLEVRMSPAAAHTDAGRATIAERRRATELPVVIEIVQTCDFEAVVTWVLAVRSPEPYRLIRLDEPSRLAVDVRHRR